MLKNKTKLGMGTYLEELSDNYPPQSLNDGFTELSNLDRGIA
jgi:hypothetical protein